jgi:two-component system, chemotaxis family, response regulator PixG
MLMVNKRITSTTANLQDFVQQLQKVQTNFFSGSLIVNMHNADSYLVFKFHMGRLNWSGRSFGQFDCWRRHLGNQISGVDIQALATVHQSEMVSATLVQLMAKQKITRQQLSNIITVIFEENLFDAIQFAYIADTPFSYEWISSHDQEKNLTQALPLLAIKLHVTNAFEKWQRWQGQGFGTFYHNLSIQLTNSAQITDLQLTDKQQKLLPFLTNGYNLRNLANSLRQPVHSVAEILLPLVQSQIVTLIPPAPQYLKLSAAIASQLNSDTVLDDRSFTFSPSSTDISLEATVAEQPLIACIDDSEMVYHQLLQILIPHRYQVMGIQDSIQALPALIKAKPDIIFLDLIMPIANGYEICAQIRRTPALRNVPVIILTGKDGMIDKFRSKMVGANDFMSKPINPHAVLKMLFYHLPVQQQ